jgi:aryl-alcohol dehydrogenase-like predicted oxidoreductase
VAKRLRSLHELCNQGKVRAVGATHYQHSAFPELMEVMRSGQVSYVQVPYNVLDREVEARVLPLAAELNLGIIIMQPLGVGALARKAPPRETLTRFGEFGVTSWPQVLLKWLVSDPRVTTVIPATSNPEHAKENAQAGNPPWFGEAERREIVRLAESL